MSLTTVLILNILLHSMHIGVLARRTHLKEMVYVVHPNVSRTKWWLHQCCWSSWSKMWPGFGPRSAVVTQAIIDVVSGCYKICIAQSCCYNRRQEYVTKWNTCGAKYMALSHTHGADKTTTQTVKWWSRSGAEMINILQHRQGLCYEFEIHLLNVHVIFEQNNWRLLTAGRIWCSLFLLNDKLPIKR